MPVKYHCIPVRARDIVLESASWRMEMFVSADRYSLTLKTSTITYGNSVDPDETAHEPSHQDLYYCQTVIVSKNPIENNGHGQIQKWTNTLQELKG